MSTYSLINSAGSVVALELRGREEWALSHLLAAGEAGCTPIGTPGPRWSDYVFKLRRRGVDIRTITEVHGGPFSGHHARYVLRSRVHRGLGAATVLQHVGAGSEAAR